MDYQFSITCVAWPTAFIPAKIVEVLCCSNSDQHFPQLLMWCVCFCIQSHINSVSEMEGLLSTDLLQFLYIWQTKSQPALC